MLQILLLITPIFSLIALGFVAAKTRYLTDGAARGLVEFGFKVAVPAMLLRAMSTVGDAPVSPLFLLAAYGGGILATWIAATLATRFILRRPAVDAPSIAMGATFGNGVMLGIPILLGAFGPDAATPIAVLVSIETACLWLLAMTHLEIASRGLAAVSFRGMGGIIAEIARNPIVLSIAGGLTLRYLEIAIPALPDRILALIGQAAIPVSLFGLGMALAANEIKGQTPTILVMCVLKLILYPAIAYVLADRYFELPPLWTGVLVLFASMPVGNNAFLFASRYERAVGSVSAAVAISTPAAVLTVTIVLALLQAAGLPVQRN